MSRTACLGQDNIRALLPHSGAMCLLDSVLRWDANGIVCTAASHRCPDNPLRGDQGLAAVNGIEYAAQAMALHAALQSPMVTSPPGAAIAHGVIASVRAVRLLCARLDVFAEDLEVGAQLLSGDPLTALYEFWLQAADVRLVTGRASVLFNVGK